MLKFMLYASILCSPVFASAGDATLEARTLIERLSSTKIPASHPLIAQVAAKLAAGDQMGAADLAASHPGFLNSTVRMMAAQMSTREETLVLPLNDFSLGMMGLVRDQADAREMLTGDFHYEADFSKLPGGNLGKDPDGNLISYSVIKDAIQGTLYWSALEKSGADIGAVIMRVPGQPIGGTQTYTDTDGKPAERTVIMQNPEPAGLLSSRAFLVSHLDAGTNRRPVEFAFREFMCVPLDQWADATASDAFIGRDVDRFPGGDHDKFSNSCKACHSVMDGFRPAFAKWDLGNTAVKYASFAEKGAPFDTNGIATKVNKNGTTYPGGYIMKTNVFTNNAISPSNQDLFGWRATSTSGQGLHEFGTMLANSRRFSRCMVKRVFDAVCRSDIDPRANSSFLSIYGDAFEKSHYNLKLLFERMAITPQCQKGT